MDTPLGPSHSRTATGDTTTVPSGAGMVAQLDSDIQEKMKQLNAIFKEGGSASRTLKRELSKRLRGTVKPLEARMKAQVMRLPSKGHSGPGLRAAIARQTRAAVRYSGRNVGVSVVQRARGMPRDFQFAGRAFNREEGWNPQTLGGAVIHQEMRPAEWFDRETPGIRPEAQQEIVRALDDMAAKIASQIH